MLPDMDKKPEKPLIIKMAGYLEKKSRMVSNVNNYCKRYITVIALYFIMGALARICVYECIVI